MCLPGTQEGGGLAIISGRVTLSNGSALIRNRAASLRSSNTIYFAGGDVVFRLPTVAGHWLPQLQCIIYRDACPIENNAPEPRCQAAREDCSVLLPNDADRHGQCRPVSRVQPCDWEVPGQLGAALFQLPVQDVDGG